MYVYVPNLRVAKKAVLVGEVRSSSGLHVRHLIHLFEGQLNQRAAMTWVDRVRVG